MQVYRYTAGKEDWFASGLPIAGELARKLRILDVAQCAIPTCSLTETVGQVSQRVRTLGWNECVVVNQNRVVLGRVRADAWKVAPDTTIQEVMDYAPQTYRPHRLVEEITEKMGKKNLDSILVTTSDGELLGVFELSPRSPSGNGTTGTAASISKPEKQTQ
jgi:CBS domain-containing protein